MAYTVVLLLRNISVNSEEKRTFAVPFIEPIVSA
jgi:hypothetical protein